MPEPQTSADYQAAALAQFSAPASEENTQVTPAPAAENPSPAGESGASDQGTGAPVAASEATDSEPKTEPPAPVVEQKDEKARGFDALAREKAALRRQEESVKAREAQIEKFEKAQTPLEALAAKGFSYEQLVQQLLTGKADGAAKKDAPEDNPVMKEVTELKQMLMQERAAARQAQLQAHAVSTVKSNPDKFPLVAGLKREPEAINELHAYWQQTGQLPAPTWEESIELALEAVESKLQNEAEKYRPFLQKQTPPVTDKTLGASPSKSAVPPAASVQAKQSKTLNNGMAATAPKVAPPQPKTPEDYHKLALVELQKLETSG